MIPLAIGPIAELLNGILPEKMSDAEKAQVELEVLKADWQGVLGQLEINKAEATNESVFVSGWRPFIGWVCGSAFAWTFIGAPILTWIAAANGTPVTVPSLPTADLMTVLFGMLGLGGLRTFEKFQGVNKR
jgi:hypothetical protein